MPDSKSIPRYDLLVSLDRSDRTAALALFDFATGSFLAETTLDLAPEALDAWWRTLRAAHPQARLAVAFEQPAPNLLAIPRHLGGELGFVGVLHTWGRQLQHHPHLHFVVPGGGLSDDGRTWKKARRADWFLPGDALAAAMRGGMDEALRAAAPELHAAVPDSAWRAGWWVHTAPAGSGANAIKYLARYVSRTAISDERLLAADDETVRFAYTDTKTQARQECTLSADEFMRRYLQHVPPPGQHRVRYFGWAHPAAKTRRLKVDTLLAVVIVVREPAAEPPPWHLRCPHCAAFALVRAGALARSGGAGPARAPPACTR